LIDEQVLCLESRKGDKRRIFLFETTIMHTFKNLFYMTVILNLQMHISLL